LGSIYLRFEETGILLLKSSWSEMSLPSDMAVTANLMSSGLRGYPFALRSLRSRMSFSAVLVFSAAPFRNMLLPL